MKQIIGESIPDKHINLAIKSVRDWADGKYEIHNPDGYGGVGDWETNEKGRAGSCLSPWAINIEVLSGPRIEGVCFKRFDTKGCVSMGRIAGIAPLNR